MEQCFDATTGNRDLPGMWDATLLWNDRHLSKQQPTCLHNYSIEVLQLQPHIVVALETCSHMT